MSWKDSDEQVAIYDAIAKNDEHILIEAGAGAGKTTTLLKGTLQVPPRNRILFCAFNKSVADELAKKAPAHVECRTTHSLALKYCQQNSSAVLNTAKVRDVIDELCSPGGELKHLKAVLFDSFRDITSLVGLAKAYLIDARDERGLRKLVDSLGINLPFGVFDIAYAAHCMTALDTRSIDFDEMLYFAVKKNWAGVGAGGQEDKYDTIFVDEAQDLNKAQHEFLSMILKPGGRMIGCGDQRQAIYMFRGSNPDSMDMMRTKFGAAQKPLMTTWRCAQSIVAMANEIIGGLRARPTAPEGIVESVSFWELTRKAHTGDFIIGRTNALLIESACQFIRDGRPFHLANNDQVKNAKKRLDTWVKRYGDMTSQQIARSCDRASRSEINDNDDIQILAALASQGMSSEKIAEMLDKMMNLRTKEGPKLLTIHGCKGLEADRVFVMEEQLPHNKSVKNPNPKVLDQEYNMAYVAVTRAKKELFIVAAREDSPDGILALKESSVVTFMSRFRAGKLDTKPFTPAQEEEVIESVLEDDSITFDEDEKSEILGASGASGDIWDEWGKQ